jgi:phosphoketolase
LLIEKWFRPKESSPEKAGVDGSAPSLATCLLSVADHCLRSRDYVNVIGADKQDHLQYLTMEDAVTHSTKGIGTWDWASTDDGGQPDVVLACAGDIATMESLAAVAILKERFSDLKIRFPLELAILNQVDRFNLAIDVIDRVPRLFPIGAHVKEWLKDQIMRKHSLRSRRRHRYR